MTRAPVQLQLVAKRGLDVSLSAILLVTLAPLLIAIAAAVRATSPGSILFQQVRVGQGGRPFTIYKFRTMFTGSAQTRLRRDDPRVTAVGRWLRKTSLDELPQLFNVLKGEMSFVGPRPDLPHHVEKYTAEQRQRLHMKPGLTGSAQVNGRNHLSWDERIRLDLDYVRDWSLRNDLAIAFRTVGVVLTGHGAEHPEQRSGPRGGNET
ncbi:sugar transferase [Anaeromyxobacter oryzisoli]|uniref:sugar transferase n=1 Tax=Anaeromyxobacter oryzisoli TaxID=2925408 RepID=UPI001F5AC7B0|nr:sugar transferase [Anaeromyxobacter sp. SG63]